MFLVAALSRTESMFHRKSSSPLHHHHPQLLSSLLAHQGHLLHRPLRHLNTHRQLQPVRRTQDSGVYVYHLIQILMLPSDYYVLQQLLKGAGCPRVQESPAPPCRIVHGQDTSPQIASIGV